MSVKQANHNNKAQKMAETQYMICCTTFESPSQDNSL